MKRSVAAWALVTVTLTLLPATPIGAATSAPTRAAVVAGQHPDRSELARLLDRLVAAGAPGAAAVVDDGRRTEAVGRGVADLRSRRPMRPHLNYRAGSVTKPMVATVVLQLVGEGRLSLSDTVERWLPGILPYGGQVTLRHLLTMTSGVPEYLRGPVVADVFAAGRFRSWAPHELVALVAARPPTFPPGTGSEYSNTNYVLAGMIVEAVTGRSLGTELTRRVFRPLRLSDTSFPVDNPTVAGRAARGYSLPVDPQQGPVEGGPLVDITRLNPSFAWGAGNVVSDLDDLTRFLGALLAGRLLPPALLAEMTTGVDTGEPGVTYGLGLQLIETPCGRVVGHDGSIPGYHTMVLATEDGRARFAVVVNQYFFGRPLFQTFNEVVVALMGRLFPGCAATAGLSAGSIGTHLVPTAWTHPTRRGNR
jgi:D-alanyl-D-alanine carboxypeptidase